MDTFYISNSVFKDTDIPASALVVDQNSTSILSTSNKLVSCSSLRTVAIVERGTDIKLAAKSIVSARFSFRGTSPYSPDLVLVNKFVKAEFLEACVQYITKSIATTPISSRGLNNAGSATKKALKEASEQGQASLFELGTALLVDIHDRYYQ